MSIKKSLLTMAVTAIVAMGFASSAMAATDGVVRDVTTGNIIGNGATLHTIGSAKFSASVGSFECHVTGTLEATGTTGSVGAVNAFNVPDTTKCVGTGFLANCKLSSEKSENLNYAVTVTPTDLDVTGNIVLVNKYTSCLISEQVLTFSAITLKPLKTGTETVTGTNGHLGGTAEPGEPIAGVELSGEGKVNPGNITVTATGELELTEAERCTYKLAAS